MNIVVADDHEIVRWGVTALLERRPGTRVVGQAVDGLHALDLARDLLPDVVVMDASMPGCGAFPVIRQLRLLPPMRIVVMSALGWGSVPDAAVRAGADAFITKDAAPEAFMRAVFGP